MSKKEMLEFVRDEIVAMHATIDNLLLFAKADSDLEGHLQHAGNRLDIAADFVTKKNLRSKKARSR